MHPAVERRAVDILHDQVNSVSFLAEIVDCHDVGMAQVRGGPRLPIEALPKILVATQISSENFYRHQTVKMRVPCRVDSSHAAAAQKLKDFVFPDPLR